MKVQTMTAEQTEKREQIALLGRETGGQFSLRVQHQGAGAGTPLHKHLEQTETFHVVSGTFKFQVGDDVLIGEPGFTVFIPKDTPHRFLNIGADTGHLISILSPGIHDGFIEHIPQAEREGAGLEELTRLAEQYRAEILGPKFQS